MIDATILAVIPPIVASVLTYIVSNKRSRLQHAKLLADMQSKAIEQVQESEEKMRAEIWQELKNVREENDELKKEMQSQRLQILDLRQQLEISSEMRLKLIEQVHALETLVATYKIQINELEKRDLR